MLKEARVRKRNSQISEDNAGEELIILTPKLSLFEDEEVLDEF